LKNPSGPKKNNQNLKKKKWG